MAVAIFGLVGVVLGGLLNGGVTWLAEKRRDKRAARVQARALLTLLIDGELALRQTAQQGRLLVPRDLAARIRSLDLNSLDGQLADDAWLDLATAKYMIESSSEYGDEEVTPENAEWFEVLASMVNAGVNAVRPIALPSSKGPFQPTELPAMGASEQKHEPGQE